MMTPLDPTSIALVRRVFSGKCSSFGGPGDEGMAPGEGLALVQSKDLLNAYFGRLFLPMRSGLGLGRSLNPNLFYCAMRWDQVFPEFTPVVASAMAREAMVRVSFGSINHCWVQPVDYGPADGSVIDGARTEDTGRIIDLSPGALQAIGAETDDTVTVEVFA